MSSDYSLFFDIDRNVEHLPLVKAPYILVIIICFYLYVVLKWGPNYMKNRRPYNLRTIILIYNISQIYFNLYIVIIGVPLIVKENYFELRPTIEEYPLGYAYLLLKIYDLVETCMFVFRKKQNQVSFLHIYHHVMVLSFTYFGFRCCPGGHNSIYGLINTTVHAIMYIYYFFAAYDSKIKWIKSCKKYITQIQLIQFVILLIHYAWPMYYGHCCVSQTQCAIHFTQAFVMVGLFGNFYIKTYIKKTKK